jgi:hypothetical protein
MVNEKYLGKRAHQKELIMRSLTLAVLAVLAIATVSMTKSATAHMYAPEYRCHLTASGRDAPCAVNPYFAARWRYFDSERRHFTARGPHYNLGPDCKYYTMWSWPFTC